MVDFQSRDTRRGPTTDDETDSEDEEESESETEAADPADEQAEGSNEPTATDDAGETTASADPGADASADSVAADKTTDETEGGASGTADPLADPVSGSASDSESESVSEPATDSEPGPVSEPPSDSIAEPVSEPSSDSKSVSETERASPEPSPEPTRSVAVAIVTVGVTGESVEETVTSGLESAGHTVSVRERLRGSYDTIQQVTDRLVDREDVDVVVTVGGVGITDDQVTIEAVHPLLEKALPGFGEAFRSLLFETIGTGIVAVRTAAGVADGTPVFCLPGDPEVAQVAIEEILVTEAPELVAHLDS